MFEKFVVLYNALLLCQGKGNADMQCAINDLIAEFDKINMKGLIEASNKKVEDVIVHVLTPKQDREYTLGDVLAKAKSRIFLEEQLVALKKKRVKMTSPWDLEAIAECDSQIRILEKKLQ